MVVAVAVAVAVARVVARLVAVAAVAAAVAAMSGCWWQHTCAALVEGRWSGNKTLLGLYRLAGLTLLGSFCLARVKVRPLMRWLALRVCNAGLWGGGGGMKYALVGERIGGWYSILKARCRS